MTWAIENIVRNSKGAQKDGVIEVFGIYTMVDGNYSSSYPTVATFTPDKNKEGFVPFSSLTSEIVCGWLDEYCDMDSVKASLTAEINAAKGRTEGLPW
tara:strand:- start:6 stop:299 length:294 start_codon:yes stop_codon:yes gene_type:complete